jgi:hypothetical protein
MKNITLKYGLLACLIVVGVPATSMSLIGWGSESFDTGAIIGYSSMIVAMATMYFAMRHYRDKENEGLMSFGEGMKIGLLISTMGGIAWGLYNLVFVVWIMPDFYEQYYAHESGNAMGTPEFEAGFQAMMNEQGFWFTTFGGTLLMFITVFLIGLVVSVISSLIVKRNIPATA